MTKEEAITHGKEQLEVFGGEHREFIEMAIKALEQEPCEDCVSKKAVLYEGVPVNIEEFDPEEEENES